MKLDPVVNPLCLRRTMEEEALVMLRRNQKVKGLSTIFIYPLAVHRD